MLRLQGCIALIGWLALTLPSSALAQISPPPGSAEDFQLKQAMNQLKGEPVVASIRSVAAANTAETTVAPAKK